MVNVAGQIFSKQGTLIKNFYLNDFWKVPPATLLGGQIDPRATALSDPKILYDNATGRWFSSIINLANIGNVLFAISATNDPTGNWTIYSIQSTGYLFLDQPIMGLSDDKLVISINAFNGNTLVGAQWYVFSKSELTSGVKTLDTALFGPFQNLASVHPVRSQSPTTTEYMVSTGGESVTTNNVVQLIAVTGVPPGTVVSNSPVALSISPFSLPIGGVQPGTTSTINPDDQRVEDAAWFQGRLWLGLNIACNPQGDIQRTCIRLTQIDTVKTSVIQDFNVSSFGQALYYPAMSFDGFGNLGIVYGYSSSAASGGTDIYPSLAVTGQTLNDPPKTLASAQVLRAGTANETACCRLRYGDYFGAAPDPSDPAKIWVNGEYHTTTAGICLGQAFGGTSGSCWSTFIGAIKMVGFTISPSPSYLNEVAGSSGSSTLSLTSLGGFAGSVSFASSVSPSGPTVTVNPSNVNLVSGGSVSATLTVSTGSTLANGLYNVTVNASSGSRSYSTVVTLRVGPDFKASSNPNSLTILVGSSGSASVSVTSLNGFAGTLNLAASTLPGPLVSLNPASVSLTSGSSSNATLTISTTSSVATGDYTISIVIASGTVSHSILLVARIQSFGLKADPGKFVFPKFNYSANSTIWFFSLDHYAGQLSLSVNVSQPGITASLKTSTLLLKSSSQVNSTLLTIISYDSTAPGDYTVTVTSAGSGLTSQAKIPVLTPQPQIAISSAPFSRNINAGGADTFAVNVTSVNKFTGNVALTATGLPSGMSVTFNPSSQSLQSGGTFNSTVAISVSISVPAANYFVDVTAASGSLSSSTLLRVNVAGFSVSTSPNTVTVLIASTATSQITVQGLFGYSGSISLSTIVSPSVSNGPSSSLNPTTVTVNGTSTLTISTSASTPAGSYTITVNATGSIGGKQAFRTTTVTVTIPTPDFTISAPPLVTFNPGTGSAVVTLTSVNNFAGSVSLSVSSSSTSLTASISPSPVSLSMAGASSSTVFLSGSTLGFYTVTIAATSGSISHQITINVGIGGTVCLEDSSAGSSTTPCSVAQVFSGPLTTPATQLRVGVFVQGSDSMNFFSITLLADSTILKPASVDMSGSVLASPTIIQECIGPNSIVGSQACSGANLLTLTVSAPFNFLTPSPTTGLLFTAIYNITGTTGSTTIGFQNWCPGATVPNACIALYGTSQDAETAQTATFANGTPSYATLAASPASVGPVLAGSSSTVTITATSRNGFSGTVSLSTIQSSGLGIQLNSSSIDLSVNQSGSITMTIAANAAGNQAVTIYGLYTFTDPTTQFTSTLVATWTIPVAVQDFSVTVSPTLIVFNAGSSANATVTLASLNGFAGTVSLGSLSIPAGLTISFSPLTVTLVAGGTTVSTVTFSASAGNTYSARISGTFSSRVNYARTVLVKVQDFTIAGSPSSLTVYVGSSGSSTITLKSLGGFTGSISLSATGSSSVTTSLSLNSIILKSGGTNSSVLTITGSLAGSYTVTVTASGGGLSHITTISFIVQDFSLTSSSPNEWVARGSSGNVTLTVQSLQGFSANVTFSVSGLPTGSSYAFNPARLLPPPNGQLATVLIVSASSTLAVGNYAITVIATSGSLSRGVSLTLKVLPSSESIPTSNQPFRMSGVNVTLTGTLTINTASSRTITGTLALSSLNATNGANIYSVSYNLTLSFGDSNNGMVKLVLDIPASPLWLAINCQIDVTTLSNSSPSCSINRTPDIFHNGVVDINDIGFVQYRYNTTPSSPTWDPRADVDASGIVDIVDVTVEDYWYGATVILPLAVASPSPPTVTFSVGYSGSSTILFQSYAGFSGTLSLTQSSLPTGLSCSTSPTSISISPVVNATSTLSCTVGSAQAGNYVVIVTGTKGSLKTSTFVNIHVQDFSVSANYTTLNIPHGNSGKSNITLTSLNGFSGSVSLSATISPVVNKGPTVQFSATSITLTAGSSGTSTLTITTASGTPKGQYTVTLTATSGSTVHTLTITVNVT
jgi:uncharacterized membrane protein